MTWNFTATDVDKLDSDTDAITGAGNAREDIKAAIDNVNLMIAEAVPVTDEANTFDGGVQTFTTQNTPIELKAKTTNGVYIPFFPNTALPTTRLGRLGFVGGITTLSLENEATDSNLNLVTDGTGEVQANSNRVLTTSDATTKSFIKAWVHFNGTGTISIYDSSGVDSIVDDGTGLYTINLTNNFSDTSFLCMPQTSAFNHAARYVAATEIIASRTVGSVQIRTLAIADSGAVWSPADSDNVTVLFLGVV